MITGSAGSATPLARSIRQNKPPLTGPDTHMIIRQAQEKDLPDLVEIYNYEIEFGTATFDIEKVGIEDRRPWFDAHNMDNHPLIVCEIDGRAVAYASLSTLNSKDAFRGTVELSVYVHQDWRGRGIGKKMTEAVIDMARKDPVTHRVVSLITGENTASNRMHEKLGFRFIGTLTEAGFKHGRYLDLNYWELPV